MHLPSLYLFRAMSKEYYRKKLVDLRLAMTREREAKKHDNAYYAERIKNTSSASSKASYRKSKIDTAARHDSKIESIKHEIERTREQLKREK